MAAVELPAIPSGGNALVDVSLKVVRDCFRKIVDRLGRVPDNLTGVVQLGVAGVLKSQVCSGFSLGARSAAGRYPVRMSRKLQSICDLRVVVLITGSAAFSAGRSSGEAVARDFDPVTGTFNLQLLRTDTLADADAPDNAVLGITIGGSAL